MRKKLILVLAAGFLFTGCTPKPASPAAVPTASAEAERLAGTKLTDETISAMFKRLKEAEIFIDEQGEAQPFELWRNANNNEAGLGGDALVWLSEYVHGGGDDVLQDDALAGRRSR